MFIAICDDNEKCMNELESKVREYFAIPQNRDNKFEIFSFQSGADLLESFSLRKYDIIFLDIDMPEINGMDLSARIRLLNKQVQITFVTYMEDHLPFGYRVKASGFVIKPFTQTRINSVMDDMMEWVNAERRQPIEVKIKGGGSVWLEIQEIMFIESFDHYMEAISNEGKRIEFLAKLSEMETELAKHDFIRVHRSYLVNLAYIFIQKADRIRLTTGQELPIGRSCAEAFKAAYEKYRKENG